VVGNQGTQEKKKKFQLPCIFDTHNDFNIGAALLCGFAKLTALLALSLGVVLGMEFFGMSCFHMFLKLRVIFPLFFSMTILILH